MNRAGLVGRVPTIAASREEDRAERDDSVAETPRCRTEMRGACNSDSHGDAVGTLMVRLSRACGHLCELDPCVPEVVPFEVGGRRFSVHRSLLTHDPQSLLFLLANDHFTLRRARDGFRAGKRPRVEGGGALTDTASNDEDVICIPGKSADVFEKLINLLRGYEHAVPSDWRAACREDAVYYGLSASWRKHFEGASRPYFQMIGEKNASTLNRGYRCAAVGDEMTRGEHSVTLSLKGDHFGVGVVSTNGSSDLSEMAFHHGMFYCSDGKIRLSFDLAPLSPPGEYQEKVSEVRVSFDVEESLVRWDCISSKGLACVGLRRVSPDERYRFGVWASPNSRAALKD